MINFLFALQAIIVTLLIIVILAQQSSTGLGNLAGGNSQSQFFAGRPEANLLTRLTVILVSLFFLSSMTFGIVSSSFDSVINNTGNVAEEQSAPRIQIEQ